MPVISSDEFWQPPTPENIKRFLGKCVVIKTKDGKEYGGADYYMRLEDDKTIRLTEDEWFGGRWHHIPIDEIEGILNGFGKKVRNI